MGGESDFAAAVGCGYVTPGPVLVTATFIGYRVGGLGGATAATVGVFLMPWLLEWTQLTPAWLSIAVLVAASQFVILAQLAIWQSSKQPWKYGALRLGQASIDAAMSLILVVGIGAAWQGRLASICMAAALVALPNSVFAAIG